MSFWRLLEYVLPNVILYQSLYFSLVLSRVWARAVSSCVSSSEDESRSVVNRSDGDTLKWPWPSPSSALPKAVRDGSWADEALAAAAVFRTGLDAGKVSPLGTARQEPRALDSRWDTYGSRPHAWPWDEIWHRLISSAVCLVTDDQPGP